MADGKGCYIGIDVGTQSVRAGLVTKNGKVLASASHPIKTWNPSPGIYEQSSSDIWEACIVVTKTVTKGIEKSVIRGIGFDATCSLVAVGEDLNPLSISKTGNPDQNIILWMDHRAVDEANFINSLSHSVLKFTGGKISPEMEPPKLLWLKKCQRHLYMFGESTFWETNDHLPNQWSKAGYFFDLPDFLTWKATGSFTRSLCSLVCKWTYHAGMGSGQGWQDDFWKEIGLSDLIQNNYRKIGNIALAPGEPCGNGLTEDAAKELNLNPGTPVATSIIDAHAGGLGLLSCSADGRSVDSLESRMTLICGTSTCHLKISKQPIFTPGIWGPYFSAMVPGFWNIEAGQSAAGALIDHVINSSAVAEHLKQNSGKCRHIQDLLNAEIEVLCHNKGLSSMSYLTADLHVWPDYHGNRSPLADPSIKGMICGLALSSDKENLAVQYLATLQSLAYSTKHIISCLEDKGHKIETLLMCGGLSKNPIYVQMHADITGLPVIIPHESESVLIGAALLGAKAANDYASVTSAMAEMCGSGQLIKPREEDKSYHMRKYEAFLKMIECQKKIQHIMSEQQ